MSPVDILFETDKVAQLFNDDGALAKKWGHALALRIRTRLDDLHAAPSLLDIDGIPAAISQLGASRAGQIHLAVEPPNGLIFEPVELEPRKRGPLDRAKVTCIRLLGIGASDG